MCGFETDFVGNVFNNCVSSWGTFIGTPCTTYTQFLFLLAVTQYAYLKMTVLNHVRQVKACTPASARTTTRSVYTSLQAAYVCAYITARRKTNPSKADNISHLVKLLQLVKPVSGGTYYSRILFNPRLWLKSPMLYTDVDCYPSTTSYTICI